MAKFEIIHCPVCGRESGRLSRVKAFCPECLQEFRYESTQKKTRKDYRKRGVCVSCLKDKYLHSRGLCHTCYDRQRTARRKAELAGEVQE